MEREGLSSSRERNRKGEMMESSEGWWTDGVKRPIDARKVACRKLRGTRKGGEEEGREERRKEERRGGRYTEATLGQLQKSGKGGEAEDQEGEVEKENSEED